jgi:hypothetical protein
MGSNYYQTAADAYKAVRNYKKYVFKNAPQSLKCTSKLCRNILKTSSATKGVTATLLKTCRRVNASTHDMSILTSQCAETYLFHGKYVVVVNK